MVNTGSIMWRRIQTESDKNERLGFVFLLCCEKNHDLLSPQRVDRITPRLDFSHESTIDSERKIHVLFLNDYDSTHITFMHTVHSFHCRILVVTFTMHTWTKLVYVENRPGCSTLDRDGR